jgi:hypothetical protein
VEPVRLGIVKIRPENVDATPDLFQKIITRQYSRSIINPPTLGEVECPAKVRNKAGSRNGVFRIGVIHLAGLSV